MQHKNHILLTILLLFCMHSFADPGTYYTGLDSTKSCSNFKTLLSTHISNGVITLSYGSVDAYYGRTDAKPAETGTGFVIVDKYCSDRPTGLDSCNFRFEVDFCASGGTESKQCACYIKEHTFASSWFNDQLPMRSDMHLLFPADNYTNNAKSNFPLGHVQTASFTSYNGTKIGTSNATLNFGFSGSNVFEPIDEFKGDFARAYLYVVTRYESGAATWTSNGSANDILAGNTYPSLDPWILQLCVKWHKLDPPSDFERKRNDTVFAIQRNRNPFIDFPHWVEKIFNVDGNSASCINTALRNEKSIDFSVFPNPANDFLSIQFARSVSIKSATVEIIDVVGKTIFSQSINQPNEIFSINTANLAKGIYIINIQTEGQNNSLKFVKE
jgi:endonuclease I